MAIQEDERKGEVRKMMGSMGPLGNKTTFCKMRIRKAKSIAEIVTGLSVMAGNSTSISTISIETPYYYQNEQFSVGNPSRSLQSGVVLRTSKERRAGDKMCSMDKNQLMERMTTRGEVEMHTSTNLKGQAEDKGVHGQQTCDRDHPMICLGVMAPGKDNGGGVYGYQDGSVQVKRLDRDHTGLEVDVTSAESGAGWKVEPPGGLDSGLSDYLRVEREAHRRSNQLQK
ncbi:hypothetical protein BD410DRAFT_860627 [Rickenella mellea]|uniref:Uncharacterized protein n=1 Tax=Rickenella mellea TaxID=50990 RepID=A0A4Y7PH57_9AGAM|nr:hypothetical protein BD410DRAFT_860627 [Rickenella mellea]